MKKTAGLFFTTFLLVGLVGCGNDLADKALEQGKLALASHDYDEAQSSFELAIKEGSKDSEAKEIIGIIKAYEEASSLFEKGELESAEKAISNITDNYSEYALSEDIDTLKSKINEKISFNDIFAKEVDTLNNLYEQGSFEESKTVIAELRGNELDAEQEETLQTIEKKIQESEEATVKETQAQVQRNEVKESSDIIDREQAKEILIETNNIDTSIAGVREDPEMDEVKDGVTYYFFDVYALTEGFAANPYYVSSADGSVKSFSEVVN